MCNPTDNLVQYPLPYKVVNGCLCQETTKRNKPTTEKLCNFTAYIVNEVLTKRNKPTTEKLCNFTAYIVNEVLFDDGVGTSRTMRIGGVHASGRKLPEIEITASEFKKMDWVLERWGADCIIEPVPRSVGALIVSLSLCREQLKESAPPFRAQPPSRTPRTCTTRQDGRILTVNGIIFFRVRANMMYGCSESSGAMKWQRTGQSPICKRYG